MLEFSGIPKKVAVDILGTDVGEGAQVAHD